MDLKSNVIYFDHYEKHSHVFDLQSNRKELDALSLIRIKLVSLHHKVVGPEWNTGGVKRTSHYHHIHFVVDGSAKVFHEGETLTLTKGGVYWLPANCPVECSCENSYEQYFLLFQIEWANGRELFIKGRRPLRLGDWDARDYLKQWQQSPLPLNAYWRLQALVQKYFAESLENVDEIVREQYAYQANFRKVFKYVDDHPGNGVRVSDLARVHGVAAKTFAKNFTSCFGLSPRKYLNIRLNQNVIDLLVGSNLAMSKIAEELGFRDEYYFNRCFSHMNGISPLKYRKQFAGKKGKK